MAVSARELFSRPGIAQAAGRNDGERISIRHALANHVGGLGAGLREAARRFLQPVEGNGYGRGCHPRTQTGFFDDIGSSGDLAYVVPSWVPAHDQPTRTVEGVLTKSLITHTDFPLRPWHIYYDWNLFVAIDRQYTYLLSKYRGSEIECEWDTSAFPSWAWPQEGARVWIVGRWIYDCGHPAKPDSGIGIHRTEIHPPKAIAAFRTEAVQFVGNQGPTRANNAVLYIGQQGGYIQQSINDQDYAFDLYLPPKPYAEAVPLWNIVPMTGELPVQPVVTPYPAHAPCLLRVVVPLDGVAPHPESYGAIISGGWSDPHNTESVSIQRVRISVMALLIDEFYDYSPDEWHLYIGINGRWNVYQGLEDATGSLNFVVDLDLHPDDIIHVTACGFEEDNVHDYMGQASGYSWGEISDPHLSVERREAIEDDLFAQLRGSFGDENDPIGYFSIRHPSTDRGVFIRISQDRGDYRLMYAIEDRQL